jgi:phosphoglycolate phosphatase
MSQGTYKAFIFDLDGTLLDTLPDLANVTNAALADQGFPPHPSEKILTFVGDGAASLIRQAVPDYATPEQAEKVFQNFKTFYHQFGIKYTQEFEGITAILQELKDAGIKLGIMSNKFEQGVNDVTEHFFSGLIDSAHGESDVVPRKPEPQGLLLCAKEMGVDPSECLFFGDSASDIEAAHNAGMKGVAVMWGYQIHGRLLNSNPDFVINKPAEMLNFL